MSPCVKISDAVSCTEAKYIPCECPKHFHLLFIQEVWEQASKQRHRCHLSALHCTDRQGCVAIGLISRAGQSPALNYLPSRILLEFTSEPWWRSSITHHSGCLAGVAKSVVFYTSPPRWLSESRKVRVMGWILLAVPGLSGRTCVHRLFACHLSCHHGLFIHGFRILIQSWPESRNLLGTRTKLFLLSLDCIYPPDIIFSDFYCSGFHSLKSSDFTVHESSLLCFPFCYFFSAICRHFSITSVHSTST